MKNGKPWPSILCEVLGYNVILLRGNDFVCYPAWESAKCKAPPAKMLIELLAGLASCVLQR